MSLNLSIGPILEEFSSSQNLAEKESIEKNIWKKFGRKGAVLILDMSGFSRTTVTKGLIYYLAMVQKMQSIVNPIVSKNGYVVKYDADNAFAFFETTQEAIEAGIEINLALTKENEKVPDEAILSVSIGIDYGEFLYRAEVNDFFGNPVNFACKLGEDIGDAGEILVTETAWNRISNNTFNGERGAYQVSGIAFQAFKIKY